MPRKSTSATKTCPDCQKTLSRSEFGNHKQCKSCRRNEYLKDRYGVTSDYYDAYLAQHGGTCAVCGEPPPDGKNLCVLPGPDGTGISDLICLACFGLVRAKQLFLTDPSREAQVSFYLQSKT